MRVAVMLIDLDGVLRLWPNAHSCEEEHGLPSGSVSRAAFAAPLLEQAITGRITDREWRAEVSRQLTLGYPEARAREAVEAWSAPFGSVNAEVLEMVAAARKHCVVGLVSNATDRLTKDLAALGLAAHLDFVVNSSDIGFAKPRPEIFAHALARTESQPEATVFVDDTASNVAAADALGIRSHHFSCHGSSYSRTSSRCGNSGC